MARDWAKIQGQNCQAMIDFSKQVDKTYESGRIIKLEMVRIWRKILEHKAVQRVLSVEERFEVSSSEGVVGISADRQKMSKKLIIAAGVEVCDSGTQKKLGRILNSFSIHDMMEDVFRTLVEITEMVSRACCSSDFFTVHSVPPLNLKIQADLCVRMLPHRN